MSFLSRRKIKVCAWYLAALAILTTTSIRNGNAQVVGGTIQGTITDGTGAAVSEATILIENVATDIDTTVLSNEDGFYSAPNLAPGNYKITVSRLGFATVATQLVLSVGMERVLNVPMHVGGANEVVRVTSDAPEIELGSSEISGVVNAATIRELPLNGRDWTQLATLQPGIATIRTQPSVGASDRGQRGFGTQMTINGGRPAQNNYRLDGVSINDYSNSAPGSVLGADLGSDAVAEFSVLSSNYPAEYGRSSGGVINAITRSGTNEFHGSVYEFIRNSALDASNFFDITKPPFKRNQFGATAGGPIFKDRTFIFGNYEGLRQSLGVTQSSTVPTQDARAGHLKAEDVIVNSSVIPYLPIWPLPNAGILQDSCHKDGSGICELGTFKLSGQQITPENYFTTRVDHKFSTNDALYGTYMHDSANITQPDELGIKVTGYTTGRQLVTLEENHIFNPQVVNAVRVGYSRVVGLVGQTLKALSPLATDPTLGFAAPGRRVGKIEFT